MFFVVRWKHWKSRFDRHYHPRHAVNMILYKIKIITSPSEKISKDSGNITDRKLKLKEPPTKPLSLPHNTLCTSLIFVYISTVLFLHGKNRKMHLTCWGAGTCVYPLALSQKIALPLLYFMTLQGILHTYTLRQYTTP